MATFSSCTHCGKKVESSCTVTTMRGTFEGLCSRGCGEHIVSQVMADELQPIIEKLCKELNGGDSQRLGVALADALNREHRYLQGEFMQMLWHFFRAYAENLKSGHYDDRNEWAVRQAGIYEKTVGEVPHAGCPTCARVFENKKGIDTWEAFVQWARDNFPRCVLKRVPEGFDPQREMYVRESFADNVFFGPIPLGEIPPMFRR